jgi:hypothetical protein
MYQLERTRGIDSGNCLSTIQARIGDLLEVCPEAQMCAQEIAQRVQQGVCLWRSRMRHKSTPAVPFAIGFGRSRNGVTSRNGQEAV